MSIENDRQSIIILFNDKKYDEVISTAFSLFAEQKIPFDVKQKIALSYFYKKDYENSLSIFEEITSEKNDVESWFNVLTSLLALGKMSEAKEIFNKILKMHKGLKSQQTRELAIPFIRYYYACGLCDAGFYDDALEQIGELKKIYMQLKITDDTFLYIRGVPFLSQTLELAKKIFNGLEHDFGKSDFIKELRINVDDDGRKLISTYSGTNEKDKKFLRDANESNKSPQKTISQIVITNLMLGVLAIAMVAIIIVLTVANPANKPIGDLLPAIIMCSVIFFICVGVIIYIFALGKLKLTKEKKPKENYAMRRKQVGKAKFMFTGAKDEFVKNVQLQIGLFNSEQKADFITEIKDGNLSIGIGRIGHGGGLWYEPIISENDNSIVISGMINDVSWHSGDTQWWQNFIMWVFVVIPLYIVFSPIILFRLIFYPLFKTPQKQLVKFMVKYVNCTEIRKNKSDIE